MVKSKKVYVLMVRFVLDLSSGEIYDAEYSGVEHNTREEALKELDELQHNVLLAGNYCFIKENSKTLITHNVVCSIIHGESKLEFCTFANGDRAFLFYYQGELKHTQRITTHMVNPISHMGTKLLEMMDRNEQREFDHG